MIIRIAELSDDVRQVDFTERADRLNEVLSSSPRGTDHAFDEDLRIRAEIYRGSGDLYFSGRLDGKVRRTCPRCLDDFDWQGTKSE